MNRLHYEHTRPYIDGHQIIVSANTIDSFLHSVHQLIVDSRFNKLAITEIKEIILILIFESKRLFEV